MKRFSICYFDSNDDDGDYWIPIDLLKPFKDLRWKIRGMIYNRLDKLDNPQICKLIKRHRFDKTDGLLSFKRRCLRCQEEISLNILIPQSFIDASSSYADWKEYAKISILPGGTVPIDVTKFRSEPNE